MTLRVGFDEQIFLRQRHGGISRMFSQLVLELREMEGVDPVLPFRWAGNEHLPAGEFRSLGVPGRWWPFLGRTLNGPRRRHAGLDLVHHTFYDRAYLSDHPGVPRVCTVVDMIPEQSGPGEGPGVHLDKAEVVAASDGVICISEATRKAMREAYGETSASTAVIHLAVSERFFRPMPPPTLPTEYLLFVGVRDGYKDFRLLLQALAASPPDIRRLPLVVVGGGRLTRDERRLIAGLGLAVEQRTMTDDQLSGAYGAASAFVFPSRAEGFGLPAVEAMAAGCPVLLADTPVFREIADGVEWFAPGDPHALADGLQRVLRSGPGGQAVRVERARTFTWRRMAEETVAFYGEVLGRQ